MDKYTYDLELNNTICEAAGCFDRATEKIEVKAGPQKVIHLLLCNHCVSKFEEVDCPTSNTVLRASYSLNEVKENVH
jgi:hypothetical protein